MKKVLVLVVIGLFLMGGVAWAVGVPNLLGLNWSQAEALLAPLGLSIGSVSTAPSNIVSIGLIADWTPRGDVTVGTAISIIISTGPGFTLEVPNLVGLTLPEAETALGETCLCLGNVSYLESVIPAGRVLSTNPEAGINLPCESTVNLIVSAGSPTEMACFRVPCFTDGPP